ncbi:MAG: nitrous oxide reductase accessory protein NosL [Sulfurimonas sp.]
MKTILLLFLLSISLIALEKEVPKPQNAKQELSYIIDAKNYGLIDAKKAFFVINSHKYGTMQDYFAFAEEKDAKEHVQKYGGAVVDYETYMKLDDNTTK